jgi:cell division protein FtsQ
VILILIFCGGIFYLICFASIFQIKEIKISGNEKIPSENISSLVEEKTIKKFLFLESRSIFLANFKEMKKNILEKFPQIWQVSLKRGFPNTIFIQIEERKPVAIFCQDENNFLIDKEGIIFEKLNNIENPVNIGYPTVRLQNLTLKGNLNLGEKAIEKELLSKILEINSKLNENLKIQIVEASIVSEERLNVKTSEGWEVYFNLKEDLNWQLTKLSLVLKERIPPEKRGNLKYIDLRFGKIYVFPETY